MVHALHQEAKASPHTGLAFGDQHIDAHVVFPLIDNSGFGTKNAIVLIDRKKGGHPNLFYTLKSMHNIL